MTTFDAGYALLIGVDQNATAPWALPDVAKDIAALREVLADPERCAYPAANVRVLTGESATRQGILEGLRWLRECLQAAATDAPATAVIYYSGHGWRDTAQTPPDFYLIPYDVSPAAVRSSALRAADFAAEIAAMQPRRLLVLLDCCHAGGMGVKDIGAGFPLGYHSAALPPALFMEGATAPAEGVKGLEDLAQGRGRAVLNASTGDQTSYIRRDRSMSIFTFHLIEALTGYADPPEGAREVLVSDIMSHVTRRVPASAQRDWGAEQTPDYQVSGNFPIALLRGGKGITAGAGNAAPPAPEVTAAPAATTPAAEPSPALRMARRALAILEQQAAGYTALSLPVHLQIELEEKRREVAALEAREGFAPTPVPSITSAGAAATTAAPAQTPPPAASVFDQRGQQVGTQINVSGDYNAAAPTIVISGNSNVIGNGNVVTTIPDSPRLSPPPSGTPAGSAALRARLQRLDAVELETLCLDHFPTVYDKFARGMRRDEMLNLLLDHCRRHPEEAQRLERLL